MLAAAPILCALLATLQVPTGTLGDGFVGSRVGGVEVILEAAPGLEGRPSQESHWLSPFTYGETASGPSRQYNGRIFDPGTGFHDYGARMYWPQIGRFISADSVMGSPGSPMTLNRYSYVLNNPYKFTDPTGNTPEGAMWGAMIGGTIGGGIGFVLGGGGGLVVAVFTGGVGVVVVPGSAIGGGALGSGIGLTIGHWIGDAVTGPDVMQASGKVETITANRGPAITASAG